MRKTADVVILPPPLFKREEAQKQVWGRLTGEERTLVELVQRDPYLKCLFGRLLNQSIKHRDGNFEIPKEASETVRQALLTMKRYVEEVADIISEQHFAIVERALA